MSIQLKKKQVKLPFNVSSTSYGAKPQQTVCGICHESQSKYICPRCNIFYCSLVCFRAESHAQCSEPFYQSSVREAIAADPSASREEKQKMMEMLQRFEAGQLELDPETGIREVEEDDGEDEEDGLEESEDMLALQEALAGVDVEEIDSNQLFSLLPPALRTQFISLLKAPESEETQELLTTAAEREGATIHQATPWFDVQPSTDDEDEAYAEDGAMDVLEQQDLAFIDAVAVPQETAVRLIYNVLAIGIAYIHLLRQRELSALTEVDQSSSLASELKDEVGRLLPFVVAARSTDRSESVRQAWEYVWPRCQDEQLESKATGVQTSLVDTLRAAQKLLQPPLDLSSRHRFLLIILDLYSLFSRPKSNPTVKKLAFYARSIQLIDRSQWLSLVGEVAVEINKLEKAMEDPVDEGNSQSKLRIVT